MKNNYLSAIVILALLLFISVAINVSQWRTNRDNLEGRISDNRRLSELVEAKQAEIDTASGRIQELRLQVAARKAQDSVAIEGLKKANFRLSLKIQELRPLIAPDLAENDTLNAFVMLQDSLLAGKDSLLRDTELFCQLQVRDLSKIIELQEQKFEAQKQITAAVTEQLAKETRDHRKTKRRSALKSVGLGILTGGIIYISIRE